MRGVKWCRGTTSGSPFSINNNIDISMCIWVVFFFLTSGHLSPQREAQAEDQQRVQPDGHLGRQQLQTITRTHKPQTTEPQIIVLCSDLLRDWHRFTMGWQHLTEHDRKPQGRCAAQPLSPFDVIKLGFVPALKLGKCSVALYWSPPLCFMNLLAAASFSSLPLSLSHTHTPAEHWKR